MGVLRRIWERTDGGAALLLLMPALLCALNAETFLPDMFRNGIDPNVYTGYFTDIHHLEMFRDTYYGTRLPWIIPGYLSHKFLPPLAAQHVLHIGYYCSAVLALYFTLRWTVGFRSALATAALFAGNSTVIAIFTWDFPDAAGICYYLLTLAALTRAAESPRPGAALFGAGAAISAAMYTYTVWWPAAPCPVVYWLMANRAGKRHPLLTSVLWAAAGAMFLTAALGAFSVLKGGRFLFFMPMFEYTLAISGRNPEKHATYAWLRDAPWLVVPAMAVAAAVLQRVFGAGQGRVASSARRFQAILLLQIAILTGGWRRCL